MNIYLDIDGVILTRQGDQMPYLKEFFDFVFKISPTNVYWLTTHCKDGTTDGLLNHLKGRLDTINEEYCMKVKPTKWQTLKTEAIDFDNEFWWFDDYILTAEQKILEQYSKLHSWVKVENNLKDIVEDLCRKYGGQDK